MLTSKKSEKMDDKILNSIYSLTSKCWDIGSGLRTFAFDLNGYPRELDWKDMKFMHEQVDDLMELYYKISEIIEAQDNLRRQNLTKTEN